MNRFSKALLARPGSFISQRGVPPRSLILVASLALVAGVGCGSGGDSKGSGASGGSGGGSAGSSSGGQGVGGSSGSSGGGSGGSAQDLCAEGPGYAASVPATPIDRINARIIDLEDQPVEGTLAQVCGTDICLNGTTNANGQLCQPDSITCLLGISANALVDIRQPALKYGDGLKHVKFAYPISGAANQDLGELATSPIDPPGSGVAIKAGEVLVSNGVELLLPENGYAVVDPLSFIEPAEKQFRAVVFEPTAAQRAIDASLNLELMVGTTPVETKLCPPAHLSLPNQLGWEPGTEVEFWIHGVSIEEEWAAYAGWGKVSDGVVSADGSRIETAEGQGIPMLSVLGIRRKWAQ